MRALSLPLLAIFAFACQMSSCPAQTAPPEKTGAPQALTGPGGADKRDDALSPSTLPKARQAVHEDTVRVNSLSPDEARRAARARAHAASRGVPTKAAGDARGPVTAVRPPSQENKPTSTQAIAKAPRPAPRVVATGSGPDREQARAETTRPTHHARRAAEATRMIAERMTADTEVHHARSRPASRRVFAGDRERGPRVGDVIPSDVPLYPLPPGYGARRPFPLVYEPHQAYLPGRPPFPGLRGDEEDAAYPPRRAYMEPY